MKIAEKELSYYWKIIRIPLLILVVWSIASLVIAMVSYSMYKGIFSAAAGLILSVCVFGFVGWTTVKDYKGTVKLGAWAGALTGILIGLIGGVIGILMVYLVPAVTSDAVRQATAAGTPSDTAKSMVIIGSYFGLIIGLIINGIIGAILAAIGALIAKKT
jgi:membrane protease YdiL (CAAX protease family)